MAQNPTKLIAWTPRLDSALQKLTKWSDHTNLVAQPPPDEKKQGVMSSIVTAKTAEKDTEYNGYFKIVDLSTTDEEGVTTYKIGVVDGATYNAETGVSGDSVVMINGKKTNIAMASFTLEDTSQKYLLLQYIWGTDTADLIISNTLPSEDDSILYLQIGRCFMSDGFLKIEQWANETGAYSLRNEYTGYFKLYRVADESSDSGYAVKMKEGYADAVGRIDATDITWTGSVYVNFTVSDTTEKIVAAVEDTYLDTDSGVSIRVGYVTSNGTVTQSLKSEIRLAGSYVI